MIILNHFDDFTGNKENDYDVDIDNCDNIGDHSDFSGGDDHDEDNNADNISVTLMGIIRDGDLNDDRDDDKNYVAGLIDSAAPFVFHHVDV